MNSRLPPRYLPTLTEVVYPRPLEVPLQVSEPQDAPVLTPQHAPEQEPAPLPFLEPLPSAAPLQWPESGHSVDAVDAAQTVGYSAASTPVVPDRQALAQQLIKLVQPQLEAELRSIAMELFEAQFSALLPSLHLHIEEAVREALDQALPEPPNHKD